MIDVLQLGIQSLANSYNLGHQSYPKKEVIQFAASPTEILSSTSSPVSFIKDNMKYFISLYSDESIVNLSKIFVINEFELISNYLKQYPFLIKLLSDTADAITYYFGLDIIASLKLVRDLDSNNDDKLYVLIKYTGSDEEAFECLNNLDNNWWFINSERSLGKMNIDLEFC